MKISIVLILAALAICVIIYGLRIACYYRNSQKLFETSNQFPRDYYVGSSADPEVTYVALGDSITQGTGVEYIEETYVYMFAESLAAQGQYVHVVNLARSGARARQLLEDQLPRLAELRPRYITITIGTNDATHFTNIDDYSATVTKITKVLTQYPDATMLMANAADPASFPALPPIYAQLASSRANVQNKLLEKISRTKKMKIVDLYGEGKHKISDNSAYYASDMFHPAAAGYAHWASLFIKEIQ
jgi:lysophospholipase L1-like esterase